MFPMLALLLLLLSLGPACARSDLADVDPWVAPEAMAGSAAPPDEDPPDTVQPDIDPPDIVQPDTDRPVVDPPDTVQPPPPDMALASSITESDCASVRAETHCLGLSTEGAVLLSVDTGRTCLIPIEGGLRVDVPSGMPSSLAWVDEHVYGCFGGDEAPGALQRISLVDGTVESSERGCTSVVSLDGGLLVQRFFEDGLYASFEAFAATEPSTDAALDTPLALVATDDGLLIGFLDGQIVDGNLVRALMAGERDGSANYPIELEGLPTLLSKDVFVRGVDLTRDGRIVILKQGDEPGMDVYDEATGRRLSSFAAEAGWLVTGLSCDGP